MNEHKLYHINVTVVLFSVSYLYITRTEWLQFHLDGNMDNYFAVPGLTKICLDATTDARTVRQRRKTLGLTPGQFCDARTDAGTVLQRHKTDAKRDAGSGN